MNDGIISFTCDCVSTCPPKETEILDLNFWRRKLYEKNLIGADTYGIGYGNISVRVGKSETFIITASQTGQLMRLDNTHYTKVISFDFATHSLRFSGMAKPSSESMTHAGLYLAFPDINGVIHIHNEKFWTKYLGTLPTSSETITYGSPQMILEIERLLHETSLRSTQVMIMGGHSGGIISFGKNLKEAAEAVFKHGL